MRGSAVVMVLPVSSHSVSGASGEGSVNGRLHSKYVTRTLEADDGRTADSLLLLLTKKKREQKIINLIMA